MNVGRRLLNILGGASREDVTAIARELVMATLRNSLSRKMVESIKRSAKWPFDMANGEIDELERVILDLWATSDSFIRSDSGKVDATAKNAFLDEMHQLAYDRLIELGMQQEKRAELSQRSQERYPEYSAAYDLFWKEYPNPDALDQGGWMVRSFLPLSKLVTRNLFGSESKDVEVASRIITLTNQHYLVIAKELKTAGTHRRVARGLKP
jgi:hypothetical protein